MGKYSKFIKYYCQDCKEEISYHSARKRAKLCRKCYYKTLKGKGNPMFGVKGKLNPNYKGIKYYCIDCEKELSAKYKRCHSCAMQYLLKTNIKLINYVFKKSRYGNNNPNWKDGKSFEPYPVKFNNKLKDSIRKRDNYECQNCGMTEEEHLIVYGTVLSVHHIDYNKKNSKENNLIILCNQCNVRANKNRNYWKEFYNIKMENINV